jgi:thiamine pyrophosphokinase
MAEPANAIIVADGALDADLLRALAVAEPRPWLIAADGGAGQVLAAGLVPDLVLGDLDSISAPDRARLIELGVEVRAVDAAKDESDTELCLLAAVAGGARDIRLLGASALTRPEHSIANLLLLADPRLDDLDVAIVGHGSTIRRVGTPDGAAELTIAGASGDWVSLLPLGATVEGVTTDQLRFPLVDEDLVPGPARGLSNQMLTDRAGVTCRRGRLLVVHTAAGVEQPTTG